MRRLAIAALAVGSSLVAASPVMACSCVHVPLREQLKSSDAAFVGRLVAVREVDPPAEGETISSGDPMDYVYRVGRIYKSGPGINRGRRVRVRTVRGEETCGLPNGPGELIGLFLQRRGHRWHGSLCATATRRQMRRALESASRAGSRGSAGCG